MESALKLARQYFVELNEPRRVHFISRRQSYHGNNFGSLAASGHLGRRSLYEPVLPAHFSQVSPCFDYHDRPVSLSPADYVRGLAAELEAEFQRVGPDRVAAFVAETMVGATSGCVAALPGYFKAIREVCDRHGALLILDEIMCGMGRTGSTHAWQQDDVIPDIQCVAKGLGGGYQPIGAILVSRRVVAAIASGSKSFVHGYTYQAHPVACAAALEVQRIIAEKSLVARVARMSELCGALLRAAFHGHPFVGDIRGRGLFWAVEFVRDRDLKLPFDPALRLHDLIKQAALDDGVAIYPSGGTIDGIRGDHVIVAPPFIISESELEQAILRLSGAVDRVFEGHCLL